MEGVMRARLFVRFRNCGLITGALPNRGHSGWQAA